MKLGIKLTAGFMALVLLLVIMGVASYLGVQRLGQSTSLHRQAAEISYHSALLAKLIAQQQDAITDYALTKDPEAEEEIQGLGRMVRQQHQRLASLFTEEAILKSLQELREVHEKFEATGLEMASLFAQGRMIEAKVTMDRFDVLADIMNEKLSELETRSAAISAEALQTVQRARKTVERVILAVSLVAVMAGLAVGLSLSRSITRPISQIAAAAQSIAKGDLVSHNLNIKRSDELGALAKSFRHMAHSLKSLVADVVKSSYQVTLSADGVAKGAKRIAGSAQEEASATEETTSSMEEMAASIAQVAKNADALASNVEETSSTISEMAASIEQVGKNAEVMAQSVEETATTVEEMLTSVEQTARSTSQMAEAVGETSMTVENLLSSLEQVSQSAEAMRRGVHEASSTIEEMMRTVQASARQLGEAHRLSQQAFQEAEEGGKAVYQSIESLQNIGRSAERTRDIIQGLGQRSQEIGSIVETIEEIADQTNLLALNAAIEAARAGDAGRGFAVVAEEIRKLAERSMEATKEIAQVIKQVQAETTEAVRATEQTYREGQGGMNLANAGRDAFTAIVSAMKETTELVGEIARSSEELNKATSQVMRYVLDMNNASEEVAKAARAQADSTDSIRSLLEAMNRMVQEVNIAIKEQASGGKQVRQVLERMKASVQEVSMAVREQVGGARQIVQAMEAMSTMTQDVAAATQQQKQGTATVVRAMEGMGQIAAENLKLSEELKGSAENTLFQIEQLQYNVSSFRIYRSNNGQRCWDILNCPDSSRQKCPAYQSEEDRCWLISGTWCKGVQQGDFRSKLRNCMTCEAFRVIQGIA
jgi:methyl-accepting chemotaxis protein